MKDRFVIIPSSGPSFDEMTNTTIELARKTQGTLFRKHILTKGSLIHPATGEKIVIDDTFMDKIVENFNNKVCPIVQVPLANDKNEHSEAPDRNVGEVVSIEVTDDKLYAILDARDESAASKIGKTYLGASAMLHTNYTDTKTGAKVGPTLLHTCITNRPYITDLEDYEEIVAASADITEEAVLLTQEPADEEGTALREEEPQKLSSPNEETRKMTRDEMLNALKEEHGIDVESLQTQAAKAGSATELSNAIVEALKKSQVVTLSNTEDSAQVVSQVTKAVTDLATDNVALTKRLETLEEEAAVSLVKGLVKDGRVMPSQEGAMVKIKLSNPTLFDELVPDEPFIKMSNEDGIDPGDEKPELDVDKEIARLSAMI